MENYWQVRVQATNPQTGVKMTHAYEAKQTLMSEKEALVLLRGMIAVCDPDDTQDYEVLETKVVQQ